MVGGFELRRGDVAAGAVEPAGVPEVDPFGGRELDLLDRSPGSGAVDQLGLVQPVDSLGVLRPGDVAAGCRLERNRNRR